MLQNILNTYYMKQSIYIMRLVRILFKRDILTQFTSNIKALVGRREVWNEHFHQSRRPICVHIDKPWVLLPKK